MTAEEFLISKNPEMEEEWNKYPEMCDDNWVAEMMKEYALHIAEQAVDELHGDSMAFPETPEGMYNKALDDVLSRIKTLTENE